ncbi:AraC family transcriptional regulator [Variovorax robiniae]|uniref:AraC family transcriptional regulator n=1 Tax=Variovorax robiniae TaxID=1836199 RepID=A0ABU8X4M5_9BURK
MLPDREVVNLSREESFTAKVVGYPSPAARWHFHPEFEIHLVFETEGVYFVGDHIGRFQPGHLVMMGPDLPHNWISDQPAEGTADPRGIMVQFGAALADGMVRTFPEFRKLAPLLGEANAGLVFSPATATAARPIMEELVGATGLRRVALLLSLFELLFADAQRRRLASASYKPEARSFMSHAINHVLAHIGQNLHTELREPVLAGLVGRSPSAFSRAFRKHTGQSFVRYVNELRISRACELLAHSERPVLDVCLDVGFNNLSNFNRQFLMQKSMPPSKFRRHHRMQAAASSEGGYTSAA